MDLEYEKITVDTIAEPVQATGICLNHSEFINEVWVTARDGYDCGEEQSSPFVRYRRRILAILKNIHSEKKTLPRLFSVRMDKENAQSGKQIEYVFEVMEKSYFERKCRCAGLLTPVLESVISDTDCVVVYLGLEM